MMLSFSEKVYKVAKKISKGRISTYKEIAQLINSPKSSRAVGNVLNKNPFFGVVPCHRVIRSDGLVGGYAKGLNKKIKILKEEGVEIKHNKIDLKKFSWRIK